MPDIDTRAAARLHYGWVIVATFCVTETVTWGIIFYGFPVFLRAMEQDLRASSIVVTGAFSVGLGVSALAAVPVGRWLDRHGAHGLSGKLSADAARAPRLRSTRYGTGAR